MNPIAVTAVQAMVAPVVYRCQTLLDKPKLP